MVDILHFLGAAMLFVVCAQLGLLALASVRRYVHTARIQSLEVADFEERIARTHVIRKSEEAHGAPWSGWRKFEVTQTVDECGGVKSFYLRAHDQKPIPGFLPGQFLTFQLDIPGQQKKIVRCYSLSDCPRDDHYRVTIKRLPEGLVSGFFHDHVKEGSILDIKAPSGGFFLDTNKETPVVLIGGGVGITPLLSMLNSVVESKSPRKVWLFFGVRNSDEHIMKAHLDQIAREYSQVELRVCYSQPLAADVLGRDYHHGERISLKAIKAELGTSNYDFFICGSAPMMKTVIDGLRDWGVPETKIRREAFGPASVKKPAPTKGVSVVFARSDKKILWSGEEQSLLDLAEAQKIATIDASGCHAGSCGTCKTAIKSGKVTYNQDPGADIEEGSCLTCICVPETDLVLDA